MSDYLISIPDTLYEKARRVAEQTAQQVDDVIRERLADAFDEPLAELPPMKSRNSVRWRISLTIPCGPSRANRCQPPSRNGCRC